MSYDELFRRLHDLDQKLQYLENREEDAARHTSQQLQSVETQFQTCMATVAKLELKAGKDVQRLEEALTEAVQTETHSRNELEARLRTLLDEESATVRTLMSTQEQSRTVQAQQWLLQAQEQLAALRKRVDTSIDTARAEVERSTSETLAEAKRVEDLLSHCQLRREEGELQLLKVLEDSCVQLHQEIVQERIERAESHKRLERLLLEAVNRRWTRT